MDPQTAPAEMNAPSLTLAQLLAGAIFVIVVIVVLVTDVESDQKQVIDLAKFIIPALIGGDAIVRHGRATNPNVKPKENGPKIS